MAIILSPLLVGAYGNINLNADNALTGGASGCTFGVESGTPPPGLRVNSAAVLFGTPTTPGTYTFTVLALLDEVEQGVVTFSVAVTQPTTSAPTITMVSLPGCAVGATYDEALAASGGTPSYTYAAPSGLPPGITLNGTTGVLSGTATTAGIYGFAVTVYDSLGLWSSTNFTIVVTPTPPVITTSGLPAGNVGAIYSATLTAEGGTTPYSFSIGSGALPPGLFLDAPTGTIFGVPTTAGTTTFGVTVTDAGLVPASATLSIVIAAASAGGVTVPMAASGTPAPILLVEMQTASGNLYFWSEYIGTWPSVITGEPEEFLDWLTGQPKFNLYGSTQTDTATLDVQNISGNTVARDIASAFSGYEFIGALVVCRIWRGDAMAALFTFVGLIANADVDENQMQLTVEGFGNFSATPAPSFNIDVTCPLIFGSLACGSTSSMPCDQSYGGCLSVNRFAGVVTQWDQSCPNVQYAQPAPAVFYNPARPF